MSVKRRILIFSTAYLPLIGGAELAVKEIIQRLPDWRFDMITARIQRSLAKYEKIGNINVYRMGFGVGFDKFLLPFLGFFKALELHKTHYYDLIWAIMASFGGLSALFFKLKNPKVPFLLTLQEGDSPEHIQKRAHWLGPFFKKIFQKADYIQAISNYLKKWAIKMGASCSIEVVPNGVDIKKFSIFPPAAGQFSIKDFRKKLGIGPGEKVIVTVSRLVPKNGMADLIDAFKIVKSQNINSKLLVIGSGPLKKKLALQVTRYKLHDRVLFLGTVPYKELPDYYAIADVFVRPSLSEGLGSVFLEAMAAGVPIIGTPVGGIPDFLRDGETGLFCRVNDPKSIAEKINLLLTDEALRKKLISNTKKLVEEKYTWDIVAQRMEKIFNKLSA